MKIGDTVKTNQNWSKQWEEHYKIAKGDVGTILLTKSAREGTEIIAQVKFWTGSTLDIHEAHLEIVS